MCWLMQDPTSLSLFKDTGQHHKNHSTPRPSSSSSSSCPAHPLPVLLPRVQKAPPSPGPPMRDSTDTYSSPLFLGPVFKSYRNGFLIALIHLRFSYSSWSGPQYLSPNNFFAVLSAPLYVKEVNLLEAHS